MPSALAVQAAYRARPGNRERARAGTKAWRQDNPEKRRAQRLLETGVAAKRRVRALKQLYGITPEQYEAMLAIQGGGCRLCGRPPKKKRLSVDHDHGPSKRVRGLLCFFCNRIILGRGRENADMHDRAAAYLRSDFDGRSLKVELS